MIKNELSKIKKFKMRLLKFFNPFLGLFLLVLITSGCNEEVTTTGKLEVTYTNVPLDLTAVISPAENPLIHISGVLRPASNGRLIYNLNSGNYILKSSSSTFFSDVGLQIRAGGTTKIFFDSNNAPQVQ